MMFEDVILALTSDDVSRNDHQEKRDGRRENAGTL